MTKICNVDGCDKPVLARDMCRLHYTRMWKHGTTDAPPKARAPWPVRFERFIDRRGADDCWHWTGVKDREGYGNFRRGHRHSSPERAHRIAFEQANGFMPIIVMHECDNPSCVNPAHLAPGDQGDNMRDMRSKGRGRSIAGTDNHNAVLDEDKVRAIRAATGSQQAIADKFGVSRALVGLIRQRKRWGHVT